MKKIFFLFCFLGSFFHLPGQTLKPGYYVSEDGLYYRNIDILSNGHIKAATSIGYDEYQKTGDNLYKGIQTVERSGTVRKASYNYYLEVISNEKIKMYREGQTKVTLNLTSNASISKEMISCSLYDKYMKKMSDEPLNAQLWSLCAGAALELCNAATNEMRERALTYYVESLKRMEPGNSCPCADVIPDKIWKSGGTSGNSGGIGFPVSTVSTNNVNQNNQNNNYTQLLRQADENYYSGDYSKALELYKTASKAGNSSDNYIKDRINSLSQSTGKTSSSNTGQGTGKTDNPPLDINSYIENQFKNNPTLNQMSDFQLKDAENFISQYEKLLNDYTEAFKKSLNGIDYDLDNLLQKTSQLEEFSKKFSEDQPLFTEAQLERIRKITARFTDDILSISNNISSETVQGKSKYYTPASPKLPVMNLLPAVATSPVQNNNSGATYVNPQSNTKAVELSNDPPGARRKKN